MRKVRLKVDKLIEDKGVKQSEIAETTKLRPSTISKYKNGYSQRYDVEVLNTLINYFEIDDIRDILEIVEE